MYGILLSLAKAPDKRTGGRQNNDPLKEAQFLIRGAYAHITFHGKSDFVDVLKGKI